jgi:hypothetical protein
MNYSNREQRLVDFETWLLLFQESYSKDFHPGSFIQFDEVAAKIMNENYWVLRAQVETFMPSDSRINMSKIVAGVQTIILLNQPFDPPAFFTNDATKEGIARVNAEFAWSVCINILLNGIIKAKPIDEYRERINKFYDTKKFLHLYEYHLIWCQKLTSTLGNAYKKTGELRITYFLLSQFWQSFEYWLEEYLLNPNN